MSARRRDPADRPDRADGVGPDERPDHADPVEPTSTDSATRRPAADPVLPRSADESDVGWGEHTDDDERFRREVPPHWS